LNLIEEEWSSATGPSRRSTNTRGAISRATSRGGTPLLKASRLTLDEEGEIVGAALLGGRDVGPTLDLLMVRPGLRRRGIANTLVGTAVEELRSQGETVLRCAYCVSNEVSAPWRRA
jgi:predicted N-acetyltransferase YhbS